MVKRTILILFFIIFISLDLSASEAMVILSDKGISVTRGEHAFNIKPPFMLKVGDILNATIGKAIIVTSDNQVVILKNGIIKFDEIDDKQIIYLAKGGIRWIVKNSQVKSVYSPTAVISSKKGEFIIKHYSISGATEIYSIEGKCKISNIKEEIAGDVTLPELKITTVSPSSKPAETFVSLSEEEAEKFNKEFDLIGNFREWKKERQDLIKFGHTLYLNQQSLKGKPLYPGNNPFENNYKKNIGEKADTPPENKGSVIIKWDVK